MVRLAREDLVRAKQLFEQHHPGKLVRERDRAERERALRALEDGWVEAERAPEHEAQVGPSHAPFLEEGGNLLACEQVAFAIQSANVGLARNPLQDRPCLARPLRDLDDLEPRLAGQKPLVMGHIVHKRLPDLADADEKQPHGAILVTL